MTDVLRATYADLKTVKTRGAVQLILELPIEALGDVVGLLGAPLPGGSVWVAVARLRGDGEASEPEPEQNRLEGPANDDDEPGKPPRPRATQSRPQNPNAPYEGQGENMTERTRQEHLQWCKERASEYVKTGDLAGAVGSMTSDMQKHEGTALEGPTAGFLLMAGMMDAQSGYDDGVQRWIDGFN